MTVSSDQYDAVMKHNCPGAGRWLIRAATDYEDDPETNYDGTGCGLPTPLMSICFPIKKM